MDLVLSYRSGADLSAHLEQVASQGALLLRLAETQTQALGLRQYQVLALRIRVGSTEGLLEAEVLQVIPGLGVAVTLRDAGQAIALAQGAAPARAAEAPVASLERRPTQTAEISQLARDIDAARRPGEAGEATAASTASEEDDLSAAEDAGGGAGTAEPDESAGSGQGARRGPGPLSWSIEKLQVEWPNLGVPEKIRVAKYGGRPARSLVMRQQDPQLQQFLLANSRITAEEVAILAAMGNLDPALLKRLVAADEWTRHTAVARSLICHPKATLQQVTKLIDKLASDELRRLTRTGKVRASVKQLITKKLEQRERHGR